jgi:non-heme chloroperoxidase
MPFVEVEAGVRLSYQDRGSGRPIVFVHGWGGSGDVWDYQVLDLAERFRVITVDLRGHGASDKPWGTYDYALFCRDLQVLMDRLGLEDVTLVGWSMGGHIGLKYVHTIGDRVGRLVLTGSGPRFLQAPGFPYGGEAESAEALCDAIVNARAETVTGLYANNFHRTDLDATRDWFVSIGLQVPGFVGLSSFQALLAEDLREALPSLDLPIAVFAGRHDQIWDPGWSAHVAQTAPNAQLTYFENSGHVAFVEDRHAWNEALVKFIESVTA